MGTTYSNFLLRRVIWHFFVGNGTKVKIPFEIRPPLVKNINEKKKVVVTTISALVPKK